MIFKELKVRELKIDPQVQGTLQVNTVDKIVNNFNEKHLGVLIVSKRIDGYYLMDGFHRATALKKLKIETAICQVHEELTLQEEGKVYLSYNNARKKKVAIDDYKVSVNSNVEKFVNIENIIKKYEIKVDKSYFRSPTSLIKVYDNYGSEILDTTLLIYSQCWGSHRNMQGDYFRTLAKFISDNKNSIKLDRLKDISNKYSFVELKSQVKKIMVTGACRHTTKAFELLLYKEYNKGLLYNKRLVLPELRGTLNE